MKFLWCDVETTGLNIENAAPFQIAFIFVSTQNTGGKNVKNESERVFLLNCLDMKHVEFNEESAKIHGISKETIQNYENSHEVCTKIMNFLSDCVNFRKVEKMYFCGYNCEFDWKHLVSLFNHHGMDFGKFFEKRLDVFNQVKKAGKNKILPYLPNRKLTTICEHLKIDLSNAHDALADIKATRDVAKSLATLGVPLE